MVPHGDLASTPDLYDQIDAYAKSEGSTSLHLRGIHLLFFDTVVAGQNFNLHGHWSG